MTYLQALKYLESFVDYEKIPSWPYEQSLKLQRFQNFLANLGNPQQQLFKCVQVAGSKGKGSTCAFISYILREAGYKVGLYTSPHLSDFRERIRILDRSSATLLEPSSPDFEGMISEKELTRLLEILRPEIEGYNKNSKYGPLSFFEVYTALAFVYFKEKKVDFAVLETGLGGRLDATNVVNPLVCAITPISYEHTHKLGNTLREIATEKAGIIKAQSTKCESRQNLIVISAPQEKEALGVIRNRCKEIGARLYEVNKEIFYENALKGFSVMGIFGEYPNLGVRLLGKHQLINAAVAIGVVEALRFYDIIVGANQIRGGLYNTIWPGRCEVIRKNPLTVLDGAQNISSSAVLKDTVRKFFRYKKLILVLGISSDKDIKGICNELSDIADEVVLTKANNPRASAPQVLEKYFNGKPAYITNNVLDAKIKAEALAKKEDLILVTGSLFIVGEFRNAFQYS